jgi:hypothetical protein
MGTMNRQRRAAKAERRAEGRARHRDGPAAREPSARELFVTAAAAQGTHDLRGHRGAVAVLCDLDPAVSSVEVAGVLEERVGRLWDHGWQPADVDRYARRRLTAPEAALIATAIVTQAGGYRSLGQRVAPAWMAQVDRLGSSPPTTADHLLESKQAWPDVVRAAVTAAAFLAQLPVLPTLMDPPSTWNETTTLDAASVPSTILEKVRALLAKAESTTFEAEAEAFTAKAQELMARHRIDQAVIDAGAARHEQPRARRIGVDNPYAETRALLLSRVAEANGCRVMWSKELGSADVFGFPDELDAVEELFTSLLVQATAALRREGSKVDGVGRSRTARFRRSFLVAFAVRIGDRLRETVDATVDAVATETSTALVPLLAQREEAAVAAAEAAHPRSRSFAPSASDGEGWYAGTAFAEQADLGTGPAAIADRPG